MDNLFQSESNNVVDQISAHLSLESQDEMRKNSKQECEPSGFTKFSVYTDQILTHAVYGGVIGGAVTGKTWGGLIGAVIMGAQSLTDADKILEGHRAECKAEQLER